MTAGIALAVIGALLAIIAASHVAIGHRPADLAHRRLAQQERELERRHGELGHVLLESGEADQEAARERCVIALLAATEVEEVSVSGVGPGLMGQLRDFGFRSVLDLFRLTAQSVPGIGYVRATSLRQKAIEVHGRLQARVSEWGLLEVDRQLGTRLAEAERERQARKDRARREIDAVNVRRAEVARRLEAVADVPRAPRHAVYLWMTAGALALVLGGASVAAEAWPALEPPPSAPLIPSPPAVVAPPAPLVDAGVVAPAKRWTKKKQARWMPRISGEHGDAGAGSDAGISGPTIAAAPQVSPAVEDPVLLAAGLARSQLASGDLDGAIAALTGTVQASGQRPEVRQVRMAIGIEGARRVESLLRAGNCDEARRTYNRLRTVQASSLAHMRFGGTCPLPTDAP